MKKYLSLACALLMLVSLCACDIPTPFIDVEKYKNNKSVSSASTSTDNSSEPQQEIKPNLSELGIQIKTQDVSVTSGNKKIQLTYDLVSVADTHESLKKINASLLADFENFKKISSAVKERVSSSGGYYNTYKAEITNTSNNVLSVKYTTDWYMGGIKITDYYGLNFNIQTGEKLSLYSMTDNPGDLLTKVKGAVKAHLTASNYTLYDEWERELNQKYLEDFDFYIESNKLVICMHAFSYAHADAGSVNIKTNISLNSNGKF